MNIYEYLWIINGSLDELFDIQPSLQFFVPNLGEFFAICHLPFRDHFRQWYQRDFRKVFLYLFVFIFWSSLRSGDAAVTYEIWTAVSLRFLCGFFAVLLICDVLSFQLSLSWVKQFDFSAIPVRFQCDSSAVSSYYYYYYLLTVPLSF